MIKKTILLVSFCLGCSIVTAQQHDVQTKYRRSSLYSILIKHPDKEFCNDIVETFKVIPLPEKFNDHNLSRRVINASVQQKTSKKKLDNQKQAIDMFVEKNCIGRRLVAKWFNRTKAGACNMDLITQRGYYDASLLDIRKAALSIRGKALLADAGEELIGKTFVLVNDIRYVDKEETADLVSGLFGAVSTIAGAGSLVESAANLGAGISDQIAGFKVIVTSHLYQLEWTDEDAAIFYQNYYMDAENLDPAKCTQFNADKTNFQLKYIGNQSVFSGKTSIRGVQSRNDMIRKVCTRAIDKAIAELQANHEEFRVKSPLISCEPITAAIGRKEDVDEESRFEVLEVREDESGKTSYKRVGVIKPVKDKIWDNRYMAIEEESEGAELKATTFQKVSGGDFYPGMLIREIK